MTFRMDAGQTAEQLRGRLSAAREALSAAVLRDTAAYVPVKTGALRGSGASGDGAVTYSAPYAAAVYYGRGSGAKWFEQAKAAHGADWAREAQAAFDGKDGGG